MENIYKTRFNQLALEIRELERAIDERKEEIQILSKMMNRGVSSSVTVNIQSNKKVPEVEGAANLVKSPTPRFSPQTSEFHLPTKFKARDFVIGIIEFIGSGTKSFDDLCQFYESRNRTCGNDSDPLGKIRSELSSLKQKYGVLDTPSRGMYTVPPYVLQHVINDLKKGESLASANSEAFISSTNVPSTDNLLKENP